MASGGGDDELYRTPEEIVVCALECKEAFEGLTKEEKQYAHDIAQGSWAGSLICLRQTSEISSPLFRLLVSLFAADTVEGLRDRAVSAGVSADDYGHFVNFAAYFFGNLGNYLSFGDTKFVPRCAPSAVSAIVGASSAAAALVPQLTPILDALYDLNGPVRQLGLENDGVSSYYSPGMTRVEIERVQRYIASIGSGDQAYNTRIFRKADQDGKAVYVLAIASAEQREEAPVEFEGVLIQRVWGDHHQFLSVVVAAHEAAASHACNSTQKTMHENYSRAFRTGDIEAHKQSQRDWVQDKGPAVECNVGFIESYQDPFGVRGEWEGFVAVVNRAMSVKFAALVDGATALLPLLPWPPAFEKDVFLRPDFTSLDVVTFASSGVPAGINIPNYDDIRQTIGFKNVSLGNVLSAASPAEKLPFLAPTDEDRFRAYRGKAFEVQVGLHELLGHGSGKLFMEAEDGTLNFDPNIDHPLFPGEKITTWYKPGETWDSRFGAISSSYEECRAECVGVYLCSNPQVLELFGYHDDASKADLVYINWLLMARAGLLALEYYTPETQTWRQAHMQGRFAILKTMLNAGQGLVTIRQDESLPFGAEVILDQSKIESVARGAVGALLQQLTVLKSTADKTRGTAMYVAITSVPDDMLPLRQLIIKHKQPRKVLVQSVTQSTADGSVSLRAYPPSPAGMIASFVDRFGPTSALGHLLQHL